MLGASLEGLHSLYIQDSPCIATPSNSGQAVNLLHPTMLLLEAAFESAFDQDTCAFCVAVQAIKGLCIIAADSTYCCVIAWLTDMQMTDHSAIWM